MDQTILINAFTSDSSFTEARFLDFPIHLQDKPPFVPCLSITDTLHKLDDDALKAMAIVQSEMGDRWAGQPVDARGTVTRRLLDLDADISELILHSDELKELYL